MKDEDWESGARALAVFLNGEAIPHPDARGERVRDDSFFWLLNAQPEPVRFALPPALFGRDWTVELDTAGDPVTSPLRLEAGAKLEVAAHASVLLRRED
jgi:glycogen operon protein